MNPLLPCWLVVLSALTPLFVFLGTVTIGAVAAYIAHGQWQTNRDKLKLDLYDRRLAVYEATMAFVLGLTGKSLVDAKRMTQYLIATRQAIFLFDDPSVSEYLKKLAYEARRLDVAIELTERQQSVLPVQDIHSNAVDTKFELLQWFLVQEKVIEEKFAPYLQLRG